MYLLLDIGGTKTRVAVSKDGKTLFASNIFETSLDFQEGISNIRKTAGSLIGGEEIKTIVCGIAGSLNRDKSILTNSPHLSEWVGKPVKKELEDIFHASVFLENDSALAGLGEAVFGAGKEDKKKKKKNTEKKKKKKKKKNVFFFFKKGGFGDKSARLLAIGINNAIVF